MVDGEGEETLLNSSACSPCGMYVITHKSSSSRSASLKRVCDITFSNFSQFVGTESVITLTPVLA